MTLFGKKLGEYARFARVGIGLILLVGLARFIVGVSGVPYERAMPRDTGLVPGGISVRDHIGGQLLAMLFSIGAFWVLAAVGFAGWRSLSLLARRALASAPPDRGAGDSIPT